MALDDAERDDLLDRLGEEFAARLRRGEQPSLKDYADRYPELADEIRLVFPAMVEMERLGPLPGAGEPTGPFADGAPADGPPIRQIGDYLVLREIGRGGMGVVYEAEQASLGRHVALKVLPGHARLDAKLRERFRREARAAARLHHTNIVPVFGVGEQDGLHYYVMQFIEEIRTLIGHSGWVTCVSFSPSGDQLVSSGHDGTIRIWSMTSLTSSDAIPSR